jgi:hypothetical protein
MPAVMPAVLPPIREESPPTTWPPSDMPPSPEMVPLESPGDPPPAPLSDVEARAKFHAAERARHQQLRKCESFQLMRPVNSVNFSNHPYIMTNIIHTFSYIFQPHSTGTCPTRCTSSTVRRDQRAPRLQCRICFRTATWLNLVT